MGQFIPDRLFWARAEARSAEAQGEGDGPSEAGGDEPTAADTAGTPPPAPKAGDITVTSPLPRLIG